jgi:hypothetical protein
LFVVRIYRSKLLHGLRELVRLQETGARRRRDHNTMAIKANCPQICGGGKKRKKKKDEEDHMMRAEAKAASANLNHKQQQIVFSSEIARSRGEVSGNVKEQRRGAQ